jgi:putative transposase
MCCVLWLIAMRFPRVKADGQGFYHCISRFVHGLFIFRTSADGRPEAEIFLSMMRRGAAFCGIQILDYGLMANHFHLLCDVPEPRFLPESEVLERIEARYGSQYVQEVREELARYADQPDGMEQSNRLLDRYRKRMQDLSVWLKELKGGFAQDYNRRHKRYGALWSERFKSTLLEGGQALAAVAAYIDPNAVRAGLCSDPKEYRYCGYAEAVAKGTAAAFEGIRIILGLPESSSHARKSAESIASTCLSRALLAPRSVLRPLNWPKPKRL